LIARGSLPALLGAVLFFVGEGASAGEKAPAPQSSPPPPVALVGDMPVTAQTLNELLGNRLSALRAEEYNIKRRILEEHIATILLEREAKARGLSVEELTRIEVDDKSRPVTQEEVAAVYSSAKGRFGGMTEDQALKQIEGGMKRQRNSLRRAEFLKELRSKAGVKILLEPPRVAVEMGKGPSRGPKEALVTIVEFSDFQCPYCRAANPGLKPVEERYKDQIRVEFRHFPLPGHKDAPKAAEAAACADDQGKFWPMHDRLFENQQALQPADLKRYASEIGADPATFGSCLDSGQHRAEIERARREATAYGVSGTPTFFINGRPVAGSGPLEQVVEDELDRIASLRKK